MSETKRRVRKTKPRKAPPTDPIPVLLKRYIDYYGVYKIDMAKKLKVSRQAFIKWLSPDAGIERKNILKVRKLCAKLADDPSWETDTIPTTFSPEQPVTIETLVLEAVESVIHEVGTAVECHYSLDEESKRKVRAVLTMVEERHEIGE